MKSTFFRLLLSSMLILVGGLLPFSVKGAEEVSSKALSINHDISEDLNSDHFNAVHHPFSYELIEISLEEEEKDDEDKKRITENTYKKLNYSEIYAWYKILSDVCQKCSQVKATSYSFSLNAHLKQSIFILFEVFRL